MRPQRYALLCAALLGAPATSLAGGEILIGSTSRTLSGNSWEPYTPRSDLSRLTVSGGATLGDHLVLGGGWGYAQVGRSNFVNELSTVQAAYAGHEVWLGARAFVEATPWFYPAVSLEALGGIGTTWVDSDASTRSNTNQLKQSSFSPGVRALAGFDLRIPQGSAPFTLGLRVDAGWTTSTPMQSPAGTMRQGSAFTGRGQFGVFF